MESAATDCKKKDDGNRQMVIDYSMTPNKFTELDNFPLPRIEEIVNKAAQFKFISKLDLKLA